MNAQTLGMFTIASLVLAATPGPDMMLFVSRSLAQGRKAGFAAMGGALIGCGCHALLAGLGLSKLFLAVPVAFDVVRLAGAAYLFWLAWSTMRAAPPAAGETPPPQPILSIVRQGMLTDLLNPKVALFMLALLPQFMHPEQGNLVGQVLVLSAIQMACGVIVCTPIILAASSVAGWFSGKVKAEGWRRRLPNMLLGGVFAGLAARLACGGVR